MSSKKITELTENTTPVSTDILVIVDDPAGTPLTQKITLANILSAAVSDTAYAGSWNGVTDVAPSKNAVYDQMELKAPIASPTFTGTVTLPVGLTGVIRADSGVTSVDTDVTDIVTAASDTDSGKIEIAIQSEQETGTDVLRAVTPGRQQYHPSAAKFWVKWTANSTTILVSYNMTSIADTAVGDADGTIATDFSGADWCGLVTTFDTTNGWDAEECQGSGLNAQAAGTFGVLCSTITDGGTAVCSLTDPDTWHVIGYGDHA